MSLVWEKMNLVWSLIIRCIKIHDCYNLGRLYFFLLLNIFFTPVNALFMFQFVCYCYISFLLGKFSSYPFVFNFPYHVLNR